MDEDFNPDEAINIRSMDSETLRKKEPVVDKLVSEIVGKNILTTDPRLIKLITKWKQAKGDDETPDNFLEQDDKIAELKATL